MTRGTIVRGALKALCLIACAAVILAAGGCNKKVISLHDQAEFDKTVMQSDKPTLVFFWKYGCASCGALAPIVYDLAEEYDGRVVVADYQLMNLVFMVTNAELRDKYDVWVYPTVVLLVDGQMKKKWVVHYSKSDYRKAIEEALGASGKTQTAATAPASPPMLATVEKRE